MKISNTKRFSKVGIAVLFSTLIILLMGLNVNAIEPECTGTGDCEPGFRCNVRGICVEMRLSLVVAASKDSILLTDTNQYIKADATDIGEMIKTIKIYVDNTLKKSCDVPAEGLACKFDFSGSDFSTAAHTYYAEAFDIAATSLRRDPTTGTKSFTITTSPGQLIDTRIKSGTTTVAYPARGGSFAVESYILSSANLPSRSKYWIISIDGTEKKRCTDNFVPKECTSDAIQSATYDDGQPHIYESKILAADETVVSSAPARTFIVGGGSTQRYKCSGTSCVVADASGEFTTSTCDGRCTSGTQRYKCSGTSCIQDASGSYTTSACGTGCTGATVACGIAGTWTDPPGWGSCDISECQQNNPTCPSCGEAESYCRADGTWDYTWAPFVKDANKGTATSGHTCPCGTGTGTLCSYPGSYNPGFPVPNPPVTLKEKVGRAMMCKPPASASMDYVVAQANLLGANVRRHLKPDGTPRDDTIDLPDGTIIDVIFNVGASDARWQWIIPGGSTTCGNGILDTGEECDPGPPEKLNGKTCQLLGKGTGTLSCHSSGDDACTFDTDGCSGNVGNCNNNGICDAGETEVSCPRDCPPTQETPHIDSATSPVRVGEILTIRGQRLTPTVQYFNSARARSTYVGTMNSAATQVTIAVPSDFSPGQYTVRIYAAADRVSNEVPVTVTGGTQKCSPDGAACGFCPQDSQCLLDPLAATGSQCINSGQFSNDNYCDSGQWTTRTKLLALKLLKLKSADYVLFCDKKENSLNSLQYLTASNQDASTALNNFDPNNFCVLKNSNAVIGAVSLNRNLSINSGSINVFGAPNCDSAMAFNDNQYHPCSLNNVWYNKGLNSIIFSSTALSISSDQEQTSFIAGIIKSIIDSIKRLVARPPYDESYLNGIKKFRRLYMSTQGSKSIMGSMDFSGQQYLNTVIKYQGFSDNICSFVDSYSITNTDASSGIACKQEGNNFYVLVQGSQYTKLNPDNIWADLTSKLRIK